MRILISTLLALGLSPFAVMAQERIQVVSPTAPDGPMAYGISKLVEAISDRDITVTSVKTIEEADCSHVIVAGLASERPIATRITTCGLELPKQPEALTVGRIQDGDRCTVVLCGSDAVGLMYAALDTAERIGWATGDEDLFAHVRNTSESPCLTDRSVSTYTMQRRLFEQRLSRRVVLGTILRHARQEPHQQLCHHLWLRERRIHGADLSLLLRRRGVP